MRHRKQKGKLSRDAARKALRMNLCREVIDHERIQTTEAKAKAVKPELERLITLAKRGGHSRRLAMARLGQDKFVVYKLFEEIAPRYSDREEWLRASSSWVRGSRTQPKWSFWNSSTARYELLSSAGVLSRLRTCVLELGSSRRGGSMASISRV